MIQPIIFCLFVCLRVVCRMWNFGLLLMLLLKQQQQEQKQKQLLFVDSHFYRGLSQANKSYSCIMGMSFDFPLYNLTIRIFFDRNHRITKHNVTLFISLFIRKFSHFH